MYILAPEMAKSLLFEKVQAQWQLLFLVMQNRSGVHFPKALHIANGYKFLWIVLVKTELVETHPRPIKRAKHMSY